MRCLARQGPPYGYLGRSPPPPLNPPSAPTHGVHIYPNGCWKKIRMGPPLRGCSSPLGRHRNFSSPILLSSLPASPHGQRVPPPTPSLWQWGGGGLTLFFQGSPSGDRSAPWADTVYPPPPWNHPIASVSYFMNQLARKEVLTIILPGVTPPWYQICSLG